MISFFNTYPEFSSGEQLIVIDTLKEIISRYNMDHEYTNIIFMNDEELLKMNIQYLGHDFYTDIITFNYADIGEKIASELYISTDRVSENAVTHGVSMRDEMRRVIFHGMLHLSGYNDGTKAEKAEMKKLEDEFLNWALFHVKQDNIKISV